MTSAGDPSAGTSLTLSLTAVSCSDLPDFPYIAQVIRIVHKVDDAKTNTARWSETVYAVTSAGAKRARHKTLAAAAQGHWGIENGLHWVRDASMRENASNLRSGSAPRALATMRNLVISPIGPMSWSAHLRAFSALFLAPRLP